MVDAEMNTTGMKAAFDAASKKLALTLLAFPKAMFTTWLRIQFNIVCFPICFVIRGFKCVWQYISLKGNSSAQSSSEPKSEDVVNGVKRLRSSVMSMAMHSSSTCNAENGCSSSTNGEAREFENLNGGVHYAQKRSITSHSEEDSLAKNAKTVIIDGKRVGIISMHDFTGSEHLWDVPIILEKSKNYTKCLEEGDEDKIKAARQALEQYPRNKPMPRTRREYKRLLEVAKNETEHSTLDLMPRLIHEFIMEGSENNDYVTKSRNQSVFKNKNGKDLDLLADSTEQEIMDILHSNHAQLQKHNLRRQQTANNGKLEDVLRVCSNLLQEISKVNEHLAKLSSSEEKVAFLQSELGKGKEMLQEVEADRSDLRAKLLTLDKMIKEEEEYMGYASYESGFDETEIDRDAPDDF